MDIPVVIKAIATIAAAFFGALKCRDLLLANKSRLRDEALFADQFLKMDNGNLPPM